jgi:MFS family permease
VGEHLSFSYKHHLTSQSAGISLFYAGYMLTQLPGSLLLSKYKPRIIIPLMMLGWSIPTILFPFVKSPAGFACARLAVGIAEGPFLPSVALMTSSWYVREELPFRMALWHGAQTISNVLGGPFAAAVLENMDGINGMHAWEWCESFMSLLIVLTLQS